MNTVPWQQHIPVPGRAPSFGEVATQHSAQSALSIRTMFVILTSFWIYATISNVLYANSMQISLAAISNKPLFATWSVRVLQHLFLYPVFLIFVSVSLRLGWQRLWRALPLQLLLACCFAALPFFAMTGAEYFLADHKWQHVPPSESSIWNDPSERAMWLASATSFFLTYGFGVALATGFNLYQRFRDSELRFSAMERAWSTARLSALRMQLSPHTLFNLLNTIRGHIAREPATAQSMVVQFADLLRQLLNAGETEFSRLHDELKFVRLYLELQQRRFVDRMTISLPNNDSLPLTWVPSLILQPLIENAVVHGLTGTKGPVAIRVEASVDAGKLILRVVNTCIQSSSGHNQDVGQGIGLRNVTERLAVHFQDRATFTVGPIADDNWCAEICMPILGDGPQVNQN